MTDKWVNTMRQTKRLKLGWRDSFSHFAIVPFLLISPSITLFTHFEIYVTHTYNGDLTAGELMRSDFPFVVAAIVFCFIQSRALNFKEIAIHHSADNFKEAVKRTSRQLEWRIENCNTRFARAHRTHWAPGWGEMVTIIRNDNTILINSICDPNKISAVTAWGWNKKNVKTFLANLNDVLNGIPEPVMEEEKLPANEWTLTRTLLRLIIYPFCIFLIVFGVYMIIEPLDYRSGATGLGAIVIATIYLYSDLKILLTKKDLGSR